MSSYGSTSNTLQYGGISSTVVSSFNSSLPDGYKGSTVSEQSGTDGSVKHPTSNVVVVDAGSNIGVDATTKSFILVGDNSTVDFSSSKHDNGKPVSLNITVGGGNNAITLNKGADVVHSTSGNDTIKSGGGHDTIFGGTGKDVLQGGGHSSIVGGSGQDTLIGGQTSSSATDTINSGGNDLISTAFGKNFITGTGNDTIDAGQSQDTIYAGLGAETINGGTGAQIFGGGHTLITGGDGNLTQLRGHDTYVGGQFADSINVNGNSYASVKGGAGDLDVNIGAGKHANDTIFGGSAPGSGVVTVHLADQFGTINSEHLNKDGSTTLTFTGGETLHVHHVTLDFGNQSDKF